jgi:hypothetical protein
MGVGRGIIVGQGVVVFRGVGVGTMVGQGVDVDVNDLLECGVSVGTGVFVTSREGENDGNGIGDVATHPTAANAMVAISNTGNTQ